MERKKEPSWADCFVLLLYTRLPIDLMLVFCVVHI